MGDGDVLLARLGELGPIRRHGRVDVDGTFLRQIDWRTSPSTPLVAEKTSTMVSSSQGRPVVVVGDPTPQVDDLLAPVIRRERRADLDPGVEVGIERGCDLLPTRRHPPAGLAHVTPRSDEPYRRLSLAATWSERPLDERFTSPRHAARGQRPDALDGARDHVTGVKETRGRAGDAHTGGSAGEDDVPGDEAVTMADSSATRWRTSNTSSEVRLCLHLLAVDAAPDGEVVTVVELVGRHEDRPHGTEPGIRLAQAELAPGAVLHLAFGQVLADGDTGHVPPGLGRDRRCGPSRRSRRRARPPSPTFRTREHDLGIVAGEAARELGERRRDGGQRGSRLGGVVAVVDPDAEHLRRVAATAGPAWWPTGASPARRWVSGPRRELLPLAVDRVPGRARTGPLRPTPRPWPHPSAVTTVARPSMLASRMMVSSSAPMPARADRPIWPET